MPNARVRRARRTEANVARWLRAHGWPRASRVPAALPGRDVVGVPGHAIEVKARSDFRPIEWLEQARGYARGSERPCVIIRSNGQGEDAGEYLVLRRLADDELSRRNEAA